MATTSPDYYYSGAMNTWSPGGGSGPLASSNGGFTGGGYGGDWGGSGGGYGGDVNPAGAADDPFAYTKGSLLTPWEGRFDSSSYGGGGYSVPAFTPFSYANFNYQAPDPGRFNETYNDPAAFRFADYSGPSAFKAPTAEDMKADPGYQARMDAVQKAQTAAAAHGGSLNTGGFQKGLAQAIGNQASQEYQNTYNRKAQEYGQNVANAKDTYTLNQGNTKQAFDTNTANRLAAYNTRQNAWSGNANVALQHGQLGYNIAQGTWDRNEQLARQGWQDQQNYNQQVAAASAANANASYQRALDDYTRSRDEFWTNQDRQNAILNQQAGVGLSAANAYGNQLASGYSALGNAAIGAGNAQAGAYQSSGNAWGNFGQNLGNTIGGLALYGSQASSTPKFSGGGFTSAAPMVGQAAMSGGNMANYALPRMPLPSQNYSGIF